MQDWTKHKGYVIFLALLSFLGWAAIRVAPLAPTQVGRGASVRFQLDREFGDLPLAFEVNRGQTHAKVRFAARGSGYNLFLTNNEAVFVPKQKNRPISETTRSRQESQVAAEVQRANRRMKAVRMKLLGANSAPAVQGVSQLSGESNYFIGDDPRDWLTDVSTYAKVLYQDVYPAIDLMYYSRRGQLEYDFIVSPGADPEAIRLSFQGAQSLGVDEQGDLVLKTAHGELRQTKPLVYQKEEGGRRYLPGEYAVRNSHEVGFHVAAYDPDRPLIIDPVLTYYTYLGGTQFEQSRDITVDNEGNAYVIGETDSLNFPTDDSSQAVLAGERDAFITKLNPSGRGTVYSTYFGGSDDDDAREIALDASGNVYVAGETASQDFPTSNPVQATHGGGSSDAFLAKLNPAGAIEYATYLGGSGFDSGSGIAADASGNAYLTGWTESTDFPTMNALQETFGGGVSDGFLAKLNPTGGMLVYSTFIGGGGEDGSNEVALDSEGGHYVVGLTASPNFPTTAEALEPSPPDGDNGFVVKLDPTGTSLEYGTFLGGSDFDASIDVIVDLDGNAYVIGNTFSTDFPLASLQGAHSGGQDAFIAKLDPTGSSLIYAMYMGGDDREAANGIDLDSSRNAYVAGLTESADFPTINALQSDFGGDWDGFAAKLNAEGSAVFYSTYLGDVGRDLASGVAVDPSGNAYISGTTDSVALPTVSAFQPAFGGDVDAFVAKITEPGPKFTSAGIVNAASFGEGPLAPGSIATLFGEDLALADQAAETTPLPTTLGDTTVEITDSNSVTQPVGLFGVFNSGQQINFYVDPSLAPGPAELTVRHSDGEFSSVPVAIDSVAPGIFFVQNSAGEGVGLAQFLRIRDEVASPLELTFHPSDFSLAPIDLGPEGDQVFLALFGTGIRLASDVMAMVGSESVPVSGFAAAPGFFGLDQVNVGPIPRSLVGRGPVGVTLTADGKTTNTVLVSFL